MNCPIARPYVRYAHMDRLHDLVEPRTDSPREVTFILVSQVKELLFRTIIVEVDEARAALRRDALDDACLALERAAGTQRVLVSAWRLVSEMSPSEFLRFRHVLGEASGTQSYMYRALEFGLGNKSADVVEAFRDQIAQYPVLREAYELPSVYDAALAHLARRGGKVPAAVLDRDPRDDHRPDEDVERFWLDVYTEPARFPEAHRLAEALMGVGFEFAQWRAVHLLTVERMLGQKHGTGGTTGQPWLEHVNRHRFFPELWSVRSRL